MEEQIIFAGGGAFLLSYTVCVLICYAKTGIVDFIRGNIVE